MVMPLKTEGNDDKTDIGEFPYFIEPSTGEKKEISDENYIGIEVVWNNTNYWVNLQSLVGGCAVCTIGFYIFVYLTDLQFILCFISSIILL